MTASCVVDASVAVKWFVEEEGSDVARDLRALVMYAPAFIAVEVANVIWLKVRRGELTAAEGLDRLSELRTTPLMITADDVLLDEAFSFAAALTHPVYDCLYLVLARERGVPLLTADRRLARKAAASIELKSLVVALDHVTVSGSSLQFPN